MTLGLVGAGTVLGMFRVLHLKRGAMTTPIGRYFTCHGYVSVMEFVALPRLQWLRFLLFRAAPYVLGCLLTLGLAQRCELTAPSRVAAVAATGIVGGLSEIRGAFSRDSLPNVRYIHGLLYAYGLAVSASMAVAAYVVDFSLYVPTRTGLVDNAWSGILVAIVVATYLQLTSFGTPPQKDGGMQKRRAARQVILNRWERLERRFWRELDEAAKASGLSRQFIIAILIYEEMNRPKVFRVVENLVVRFTRLSLTVGIAQIRSRRPLTDAESIMQMGRVLREYAEDVPRPVASDELERKICNRYNDDRRYYSQVKFVLYCLYDAGITDQTYAQPASEAGA